MSQRKNYSYFTRSLQKLQLKNEIGGMSFNANIEDV